MTCEHGRRPRQLDQDQYKPDNATDVKKVVSSGRYPRGREGYVYGILRSIGLHVVLFAVFRGM